MVKYVIKRLLLSVLIIFGVSIILYALLRCMPMDYISNKFGNNPNFTQDRFEQMEALYGLDSSIIGGYIKWMFGDWWMPEGWFYDGSFWTMVSRPSSILSLNSSMISLSSGVAMFCVMR